MISATLQVRLENAWDVSWIHLIDNKSAVDVGCVSVLLSIRKFNLVSQL